MHYNVFKPGDSRAIELMGSGLHPEAAAGLRASKIFTVWDLVLMTEAQAFAAVKGQLQDRDWSNITRFMEGCDLQFGQRLSDPDTALDYISDMAKNDPRLNEALHCFVSQLSSSGNKILRNGLPDAAECRA